MSQQIDKGYIKFNCIWERDIPLPIAIIKPINQWRNKLYDLGLINAYKNGIGYGNVSTRYKKNMFIITGSATGQYKRLNNTQYTLVKDFAISDNRIICQGPIKASSESLSHAVIYETLAEVNAVIHIHNLFLWELLIHKKPTTPPNILYGTPEMAYEIEKLLMNMPANQNNIIIMGGHKEGIITFGNDLKEAGNILLELINY